MGNLDTQHLRQQIEVANERYKQWAETYHVDKLYEYYKGFHYADKNSDAYVNNLVYSTIETKLPSLIFFNPKFNISPRPKEIETDPESAFQFATNLSDALADFINNEDNNFSDEAETFLFDAFFGYGISEIGYSADWIDNPNAGKPVVEGEKYKQPLQLPTSEQIFVKQIPFDRFRVSYPDKRLLRQNDWVGYYDFVRKSDLEGNKNLKNLGQLSSSYGYYFGLHKIEELEGEENPRNLASKMGEDYSCIWKIWNTRSKRRCIILDDTDTIIYERAYTIFPFVDLRFRKPRKGFYPVPQVFNWIPAQNEQNEIRESARQFRRKFKRLYSYLIGSVEEDEISKAINGPDGSFVGEKQRDSIRAIDSPGMNNVNSTMLAVSKEDFNEVAGSSNEQRGRSDRTTATQASIIDNRAKIRETNEQAVVANALNKQAKLILEMMKERYVNPMTISSMPSEESIGSDASLTPSNVRSIDPITDFGPQAFDFDVKIDIESTSPVANEQELQKFITFLSLLSQFPQMSISPLLIREMAFRVGYRNERVIKEMQQMAQLQLIGMFEQMGLKPGNMSQQQVQQQKTPTADETQEQLRQQGIPIGG